MVEAAPFVASEDCVVEAEKAFTTAVALKLIVDACGVAEEREAYTEVRYSELTL